MNFYHIREALVPKTKGLKSESKRNVALSLIPFINISMSAIKIFPRKVLKATLSKVDVSETFDKIHSGAKFEF